jgi:hypothetical protein
MRHLVAAQDRYARSTHVPEIIFPGVSRAKFTQGRWVHPTDTIVYPDPRRHNVLTNPLQFSPNQIDGYKLSPLKEWGTGKSPDWW